jgi:hypothetical protein
MRRVQVEKDEKAASDRQVLLDYQQLLDAQDAARAQVLADMHAKSQVATSPPIVCVGIVPMRGGRETIQNQF